MFFLSDLSNMRLFIPFNSFIIMSIWLIILTFIPTIMFLFKFYSLIYLINKCISIVFSLIMFSTFLFHSFLLRSLYMLLI